MTIGELGCLILTDKWFGVGEHHTIINDAYPLLSTIKDVFLKQVASEAWIFKNGSALQRNLSYGALQSLLLYVLENKMVVEIKIE